MSQANEGQDRLDYRETADITEVHASVLREHAEPRAGSMPIPMWLGVLCAAALCWAGVYIGIFHGGFSGKIYNENDSNPLAFFPLKSGKEQGGAAAEEMPLLALGEKVFSQTCASCHQPTGLGNPAGGIPPLAGSEWVDGPEASQKRIVAIVLKGLKGPITVKGANFNGVMPALGPSLKPRQIAAVATYVRQAWGNKGTGEITEAQVVAAKKDPLIAEHVGEWTAEELKKIPVTDELPGGAAEGVPVAAAAPAGTPSAPAPAPGTTPAATPVAPASAPAAGSFDLATSVKRGQSMYMQTCIVCHQPTGMGVPGAFPPLVGADYVTGDTRRLIAIVLKGIMGPMTVDGKTYNGVMPPPGVTFPQLKDDKNLADVLNHVRNSFGNKAAEPITPELVGKVRAEFASDAVMFTEAALKNFK